MLVNYLSALYGWDCGKGKKMMLTIKGCIVRVKFSGEKTGMKTLSALPLPQFEENKLCDGGHVIKATSEEKGKKKNQQPLGIAIIFTVHLNLK